jgi:hypothetical protein
VGIWFFKIPKHEAKTEREFWLNINADKSVSTLTADQVSESGSSAGKTD